jgi:hypothetical protein
MTGRRLFLLSGAGGHLIKKANHRLDPVAVARHEVGALDDGLLPAWAQTTDMVAEPVCRLQELEAQNRGPSSAWPRSCLGHVNLGAEIRG